MPVSLGPVSGGPLSVPLSTSPGPVSATVMESSSPQPAIASAQEMKATHRMACEVAAPGGRVQVWVWVRVRVRVRSGSGYSGQKGWIVFGQAQLRRMGPSVRSARCAGASLRSTGSFPMRDA